MSRRRVEFMAVVLIVGGLGITAMFVVALVRWIREGLL